MTRIMLQFEHVIVIDFEKICNKNYREQVHFILYIYNGKCHHISTEAYKVLVYHVLCLLLHVLLNE